MDRIGLLVTRGTYTNIPHIFQNTVVFVDHVLERPWALSVGHEVPVEEPRADYRGGHLLHLGEGIHTLGCCDGPTNGVDLALRPSVPGRKWSGYRVSGHPVAVLPDAIPSPDRPNIHPLGLRRAGFRTLPDMYLAGPREMRLGVPGPERPAGRSEA